MSQTSILVLDSGLGGLSVVRALRDTLPAAPLVYVADTAAFPYGTRPAHDICARASAVVSQALATHAIGLIVIACNTLSTLCLSQLRALHALPFVGTVPAIKVAAERSLSKRFTLLATPNTVDSAYSTELIASFASGCVVDRVGAPHLAALAERYLLEGTLDKALLACDIAPCFHEDRRGKTDMLVLGCTHYPFLSEAIAEAAPWQVAQIDPAPAIAQQAKRIWSQPPVQPVHHAYVTREEDITRYRSAFARFGFSDTGSFTVAEAA